MTDERWQHVERLYHSACRLPPHERAGFLAAASGDDHQLRAEVESLLDHETPRGLLADSVAHPPMRSMSETDTQSLIGRRFGDYCVVAWLGAGGMGTVFRAHDARLDRSVAVKVLAPSFSDDPELLARFRREARTLASLSHPNIATIYGFEESEGVQAIVMELVDGETLAERMASRPAGRGAFEMPEALTIASQIAAALDAVHEHGVVHRDLKPANIKVTPRGVVKVLDFGLARTRRPRSDVAPDHSGSVDGDGGTRPGIILGTAAYMSPEQARGAPVDRRADIWAFGCVLYEMLVGRSPFQGETMADVIANVLGQAPDFAALPAGTPESVRRLLRRCLEKDVEQRLRDIGDARADIADGLTPRDSVVGTSVSPIASSIRPWHVVAVAGAAAVLASVAVWAILRQQTVAARPVTRLVVATRPDLPFTPTLYSDLAMSSDGARFLYSTQEGVVIRSRDGRPDELIRLEEGGAAHPFFSPDGQWIGYSTNEGLRKVPVSGGPAITIANTRSGVVGSWGPDGIVGAGPDGLFRIATEGGTPTRLSLDTLASNEQASFPEVLPGGRAVLVTVLATRASTVATHAATGSGAHVDVVDLQTGARTTLIRGGGLARYVPTGHLLYLAAGKLFAVSFDARRLEVTGKPVLVASDTDVSDFAVSSEGSLILASGSQISPEGDLVWVGRDGHQELVGAPRRQYMYPELSPDGRRVALVLTSDGDRDVWMWNLSAQTLEPVVADPTDNSTVAWTLDGRGLAFGSAGPSGVINTFLKVLDRPGAAERLMDSPRVQMPITFAPDGRLLLSEDVPGRRRDIVALSVDGSRRTESLLDGPAAELSADVSPDGRWIAYDSDESGRFEVYVRPYPDVDRGRWMISTEGGRQPVWSPDSRELFFRDFSGAMLSVAVTPFPAFVPGRPVTLFGGSGLRGSGSRGSAQTYDISPDGRRFLMITEPKTEPFLTLVLNWAEEFNRLTRP